METRIKRERSLFRERNMVALVEKSLKLRFSVIRTPVVKAYALHAEVDLRMPLEASMNNLLSSFCIFSIS